MTTDSDTEQSFPFVPSGPSMRPVLREGLEDLRLWTSGELPAKAFATCATAWPEVRESLLDYWRIQLAHPDRDIAAGALWAVGPHLAAANSDTAFLDVLLAGVRMDVDLRESLFGDHFYEFGSVLMAMIARNSRDAIARLEEACTPRPECDPAVASIPLEALALLVEKGYWDRSRLDDLIRRMDSALNGEEFSGESSEDRNFWRQWIASVLTHCGPGQLLDLVREWFARGIGHELRVFNVVDLQSVEDSAVETPAERAENWIALKHWHTIETDVYESLRWIMSDADDEVFDEFDGAGDDPDPDDVEVTWPIVRTEPKVGRNDPCPCGSGKKYKKCCGQT